VKEIHAILAAFVIFSAGIITGGMMQKMYQKPEKASVKTSAALPAPPGVAQRFELLTRITKQLKLDSTQQEQVNTILHRSQDRSKKLWRQIYPEFQAEFDTTRNEIRELLNGAQRSKYEVLLKQNAKKRAEETQSKSSNRDRRKPVSPNNSQTNNLRQSPIESNADTIRTNQTRAVAK